MALYKPSYAVYESDAPAIKRRPACTRDCEVPVRIDTSCLGSAPIGSVPTWSGPPNGLFISVIDIHGDSRYF